MFKQTMDDSHETVRVHVLVSGRVQGVGFRAFTWRQAKHHGLVGWVRNRADGRVESEAQGPRTAVMNFLRDVEQGPPLSSVEHVEVEWVTPGQEETGFEVKY